MDTEYEQRIAKVLLQRAVENQRKYEPSLTDEDIATQLQYMRASLTGQIPASPDDYDDSVYVFEIADGTDGQMFYLSAVVIVVRNNSDCAGRIKTIILSIEGGTDVIYNAGDTKTEAVLTDAQKLELERLQAQFEGSGHRDAEVAKRIDDLRGIKFDYEGLEF